MASCVIRSVLTAALAVAALLAFVGRASADPVTYKTVTARQIQQASLSTRSVVPMSIIAGMYAAGYQGDPMTLAGQLDKWFNRSGGTQWTDALADYHAGDVRGINNRADVAYARRVMDAAEHVPPQLAGAMSAGSALTLAAVVAGAAAAGGLAGVWDELAAGGAGAGAVGKVVSKAKGVLSGGGGAGSGDSPDAPAHYLSTSALAAGAALFLGTMGSEIGKATSVDVTGGWFHNAYGRAVALGSAVMLIAFLLACLEGSVRSDSAMLQLALQALPRAAILGAAGAILIGAGIAFTDQAGVAVAGPDLASATHKLHLLALAFVALGVAAKSAAASGHGTFASILGTPAALFSGVTFVASLAMLLELMVRAIGIYVAALFVPVVLAASVYPRFAEAPKRLAMLLLAIVSSKFVLVAVLGLSAGAMTDGGVRGIAVGCGVLVIACVAPWVFYKVFTVAEHHFTRSTVVPAGSIQGGTSAVLSSIAFASELVSRVHGVPNPQAGSQQGSEEGESGSGGPGQRPRSVDTESGRETPPEGDGE